MGYLPLPRPAPGYRWEEDELGIRLQGPEGLAAYIHLHHSHPPLLPPPPSPPRLSRLQPEDLEDRAKRARGASPQRLFMHPLAYEEAGPGLGLYLGPGCTYQCGVCSTGPFTFGGEWGIPASPPQELAQRIAERLRQLEGEGFFQGSPWLVVLGGEPTLFLPYLFQTMAALARELNTRGRPIPYLSLVTNGHILGDEQIRLLTGVADLYVLTLRAENPCAGSLGIPKTHAEVVTGFLRRLLEWDAEARVLVRVWVASGHTACCAKPLLQRLESFTAHKGRLWVMPVSVLPLEARAEAPQPVKRMPTREELRDVISEAKRLGLLPDFTGYLELPRTAEREPWEALPLLEQAVRWNPLDPELRYWRGLTRLRVGDLAGASQDVLRLEEMGQEGKYLAQNLWEEIRIALANPSLRRGLLWFSPSLPKGEKGA